MAKRINRMQFLRGDFEGEGAFRPPWAIAENTFTDICDRCDQCLKACPLNIIKPGIAGFPEIDFSRGGCDFCESCAQACPTQALHITDSNIEMPWQHIANVKTSCLSENGVVCRCCGDVCEMHAIRFKLVVGGSALIDLNTEECNGCGECVSVCPVQAIEMQHVQNANQLEINP
ncbi:MAG: ferredoxin-type protein NapF [Gammaproteobacteria bacterium]|nr:ferredoxin-type protein NapF [Gammaproteobacteria bacterium]